MRHILFVVALVVLAACSPAKQFYPIEGPLAVTVEDVVRDEKGMMTFRWVAPSESVWFCPGYEWYERAGTIYVRFVRVRMGDELDPPFVDVPLRNPEALPVLLSDEDGKTRELWRSIKP